MSLYKSRLIDNEDVPGFDEAALDSIRTEIFVRTQKQKKTLDKNEIRLVTRDILHGKYPNLRPAEVSSVLDELSRDLYGWGPLTELMANPKVMNIWVNCSSDIQYEDDVGVHNWPHNFRGEEHLRRTVERMAMGVGRKVDESDPTVDCRLLDGSRVSIAINASGTVAPRGTSVVIRRFPKLFTLEDLAAKGSFPERLLPLLKLFVKARLNIFTAGSMGSGKNTFLNALLLCVGKDENLIFMEDPAESKVGLPDPERPDLPRPHVRVYEPRPANTEGRGAVSLETLFERALRQQPTRLLVSECRSCVTAYYTLMAMNIGHPGSMSSTHANSPEETPLRLAELLGGRSPENLSRTTAVNLIIYLIGFKAADGYPTYRRVLNISEVRCKDDGMPETVRLFDFGFCGYDEKGAPMGELRPTGAKPTFLDQADIRIGQMTQFRLTKDELELVRSFFEGG
jgi:pilus assembly protein CpaF